MRRRDKEITNDEEMVEIIEKASICRLGLSLDNMPYIVPMNFGYKDNCIYFHAAKEGKKLEMLKENSNVCFEIDIDCELIKNELPCNWGMKYRSIIGFGNGSIVTDFNRKKEALHIIVEKYAGNSDFYFSGKAIDSVCIIKVEIMSMTGKKSGI